MQNRTSFRGIFIVLGLVIVLVTGCSQVFQGGSVQKQGARVSIKAENCPLPVYFEDRIANEAVLDFVSCTRKKNELVVSGKVRRTNPEIVFALEAEAIIVDGADKVLASSETPVMPRLLGGKSHHAIGHFTLKLPILENAKGIVVTLTSEGKEGE